MMTISFFTYIVSSLGWFLAGIGSTCLWREHVVRQAA